MANPKQKSVDVFGATLTRRDLMKAGGALLVGFGLAGCGWKKGGVAKNSWMRRCPDRGSRFTRTIRS